MELLLRAAMLLECHCARQCVGLRRSASISQQQQHRKFSAAAADEQDKIIMKGLVFHGYHGALPEVWESSCRATTAAEHHSNCCEQQLNAPWLYLTMVNSYSVLLDKWLRHVVQLH
jgi:hypothetical protein